MKFCKKCGQQIEDNVLFCPYCGTPQQAAPQPQQAAPQPQQAAPQPQQVAPQPQQVAPQPQQAAPQSQQAAPQPQQAAPQPQFGQMPPQQPQPPKKPLDKKILFIIAGVAAALLIIVIGLIFALSGRRGASSYKGAVEKLFSALEAGNGKKLVGIMMPSELEKSADKELNDGELEYLGYDSMAEFIEDQYKNELEDSIKFKDVEITDKEKLSKDEVEEIEEMCDDELGCDIDVKEAYTLEIDYLYKEKGDEDWQDDYMEITAYKVGGRWYLFPW